MSKHRFNPLALLAAQAHAPAAIPPSRRTVSQPANVPDHPTKVVVVHPCVAQASTPEPMEDESPTVNAEYAAAVTQGFADAGYPDASPKVNVFTFRQWLKRDRCVRKGQKGVRIEIMVPRGKPVRMVPRSIFLFHERQTDSLGKQPPMPQSIVTPEDCAQAARALISSRSAVLPNATRSEAVTNVIPMTVQPDPMEEAFLE